MYSLLLKHTQHTICYDSSHYILPVSRFIPNSQVTLEQCLYRSTPTLAAYATAVTSKQILLSMHIVNSPNHHPVDILTNLGSLLHTHNSLHQFILLNLTIVCFQSSVNINHHFWLRNTLASGVQEEEEPQRPEPPLISSRQQKSDKKVVDQVGEWLH